MNDNALLRDKFCTNEPAAGVVPSRSPNTGNSSAGRRLAKIEARARPVVARRRNDYETLMIEVAKLNGLGRTEQAKRVAAQAAVVLMSSA